MLNENINLQTPVQIPEVPFSGFTTASVVCGTGSCFAENLLSLLYGCGFKGRQNPCGTIYNAVSLAEPIVRIAENRSYAAEDFFEYGGLWHSWEHHGSFSARTQEKALHKTNSELSEFREALRAADLFVATPSSSVVYVYNRNGKITANCHKVPGSEFTRRLLSVEENIAALRLLIIKLHEINPDCKLILTLSPVRHYPGELVLNSRSKAQLLTAIHACIEEFPELCCYFPAYEIVMDELRDYRFYKEDMLHPAEPAVRMICGRFIRTFFNGEAVEHIKEELKQIKLQRHITLHKDN
ncbi:MAG: GSCFA domain-containing protein [Victivallaceae bacterium]|jgi:hypothetical protein